MRRILNEAIYRFKNDGTLNAGGTVTCKLAGTSTDKDVYDEYALSTVLTNPVPLDSNGRSNSGSGEIFIGSGFYDFTVKDSDGNVINTFLSYTDDVYPAATNSFPYDLNGSFEETTGGVPDNWTLAPYTDGTIAIDTTTQGDGLNSLKFTSAGVNGGGVATSIYFPIAGALRDMKLSWTMKSSVADITNTIAIYWYDSAQAGLAGADQFTIVYNEATANPTSWTLKDKTVTPPATAYWGRIVLIGGFPGDPTTGSTWIDNLNIEYVASADTFTTSRPTGLILSRDAGDTSHDVNVTTGSVRSSDSTTSLVLATEMTKQIDATWAVGDDAGGLASGASLTADTMYAVWIIGKTVDGSIDILIDDSFSTPDAPSAEWDVYNLIGVVWTDASSNLIDFTHFDDMFLIQGLPIEDVSDATITSNTFETGTLSAPPHSVAEFFMEYENLTTSDNTLYFHIKTKGSATTATQKYSFLQFDTDVAADTERMGGQGQIYVDTNSQIEYSGFESDGTATIKINTTGCRMLTRGNPA